MSALTPDEREVADYVQDRATRVRRESGARYTIVIVDFGDEAGVHIGAEVPTLAVMKDLLTRVLANMDREATIIEDRRTS